MIQINNISKSDYKRIQAATKEQVGEINSKLRVLVNDDKNINKVFFDSLNNINNHCKIILVIDYDENNLLSKFGKNLIFIVGTNEEIKKLHNFDASHLILYASDDYNKDTEERIINNIVNNTKIGMNLRDIFDERIAG